MTGKTAITGLTKEELESEILEMGQPRYRAGQVMEWISIRESTDSQR